MQDFTVKRIKPWELPTLQIFLLDRRYHTGIWDFVLSVDINNKIVYVKDSVSEEDIKGFLEYINFPYCYVNDEELGKGKFADYVCEKYGFDTYSILIDAHLERRKEERKRIAKERISGLIPLFHEKMEELDIDEALLLTTWSEGYNIDKKTPENWWIMESNMYFCLVISWGMEL